MTSVNILFVILIILNPHGDPAQGWGADEPEEDRWEAAGGGARVLAGWAWTEVPHLHIHLLHHVFINVKMSIRTVQWSYLVSGTLWRKSWTARTTQSQCTSLATSHSPSRSVPKVTPLPWKKAAFGVVYWRSMFLAAAAELPGKATGKAADAAASATSKLPKFLVTLINSELPKSLQHWLCWLQCELPDAFASPSIGTLDLQTFASVQISCTYCHNAIISHPQSLESFLKSTLLQKSMLQSFLCTDSNS